MLSFCTNFTPSATSCAQPWKPPAAIGPTRLCMCAIALCSIWPTTSGRTRNAPSTTTQRRTMSMSSVNGGPPLAGLGHAGRLHASAARGVRRLGVALPRLLRARPRLRDPRGEDELLAQRMPLEAVRQQERIQVDTELDAEHLVRLPLVPRGPGIDVRDRIDTGVVAVDVRRQEQVVQRLDSCHVQHEPEALGMLVDGREPVEV